MIEFKDFTFQYAESTAPTLHDINLTLAPGTFLGITGAAGSGKSTLTYAFNGIIPPLLSRRFLRLGARMRA